MALLLHLAIVGGSRYHVFRSAYTVPSPERIELLVADLIEFMILYVPWQSEQLSLWKGSATEGNL